MMALDIPFRQSGSLVPANKSNTYGVKTVRYLKVVLALQFYLVEMQTLSPIPPMCGLLAPAYLLVDLEGHQVSPASLLIFFTPRLLRCQGLLTRRCGRGRHLINS